MKQNQVMKWISFNLLAAVISAPMLSPGACAGTLNGRDLYSLAEKSHEFRGQGQLGDYRAVLLACSDRYCMGINSRGYGKWTCTSLKQACLQKHAGSPQCQVRHTDCMRTGTWTGEQRTFNYVSTR